MKNVVIHDPENNTLSKKYIKPTNFILNMKETNREKKDLSDLINLFNFINYDLDILEYDEKLNEFIILYPRTLSKFYKIFSENPNDIDYIFEKLTNKGINQVFKDIEETYYYKIIYQTFKGKNFNIYLKIFENQNLLNIINQQLIRFKDYVLILTPKTEIKLNGTKKNENQTNKLIKEENQVAYVYWDSKNKYMWTEQIFNILEIDSKSLNPEENIIAKNLNEEEYKKLEQKEIEAYLTFSDFDLITYVKTKSGLKRIYFYGKFFTSDVEGVESFIGFVQDLSKYDPKFIDSYFEDGHLKDNNQIKNNLQLILSLMQLDTRYNINNSEEIINSTNARIRAMSYIHEQIYQAPDLIHINLKKYLKKLLSSLISIYDCDNITFTVDLVEDEINLKYANPIGLIINELVFNSLKYAYPDNVKGNININTEIKGNIFILTYTDDGIGLPEEININKPHTLGFIIINNLIEQLDGTITEKNCAGTGFEIKFKIKK